VFPLFKKTVPQKKVTAVNDLAAQNIEEGFPLPKNILPVIQAHDWPGKDSSLHRSLCYLPKLAGTPWLSFGFDAGLGLRAYASEGSVHKWGVSAGELENVAIQNLRDIPAEWQIIELAPKDAKPVKALLCQSEGPIAERILDHHLLQQAHDFLDDNMPVAIIPSRSTLIIMPLTGDLPFRVAQQFFENSHDALTAWVFFINQANVSGRVTIENEQFIFNSAVI
jgi:uncharacterized protein YtpQ (UPF0354 family)